MSLPDATESASGHRSHIGNDSSLVGKKNRLKFANRNMYEGIEVQRMVRRATQWELSSDIDVRANFVVHGKLHRLSPLSLGCLPETSALRQFLVWLVTWRWWDRAVLIIILLNTIMLAMVDYSLDGIDWNTMSPDSTKSSVNAFTQTLDPYFTALFTIEAACKIGAMGFLFDEGAYLRDSWNVLDFVVVATSLLQIIPGVPKVSALRAFRVLRPLRTLARLKGMRMMVNSLLSSIPQLANVGVLLFFLFLVWAICAVNLFQGSFHARCRVTASPLSIPSSHLRSWDIVATPPWIIERETQGLWRADAEQGPTSLRDPVLAKFLATAPAGKRRGLYYEMLDRYFSGNDAEDVVYDASVMEHLNTTNSTPWVPSVAFYVSFAQSVTYMWNLQYNRSAFPWCGADEPVSLHDPSKGVYPTSGIPLESVDWSQDTSPWLTARTCAWPIDQDDNGVCSTSGSGAYVCQEGKPSSLTLPSHVLANTSLATSLIDTREITRTCGSNYDAFGNARFQDAGIMEQELGSPDLAFGLYGADWIGQVFLTIYQCITQEGWTTIMYWTMDSYQPAVGALYYVLLVLVGSMFLLNLVVASIFLNFNAAQVAELESIRIRRENIASITQAEKQEAHRATAKAKLVSEIRRSATTAKSKLRRVSAGDALWNPPEVNTGSAPTPEIGETDALALDAAPLGQAHGVLRRRVPTLSRGPSSRQAVDVLPGQASGRSDASLMLDDFAQAQRIASLERAPYVASVNAELSKLSTASVRSSHTSFWPGPAGSIAGSDALHPPTLDTASVAGTVSSINSSLLQAVNKSYTVPRQTPCHLRMRLFLLQVFASELFGVLMLILIILNTVTLSMDSYPGDDSLAHELEIVNFSLTFAFSLEFLGKILGMGPTAYFRDKFNIFDTIIVALSIVDLGISQPYFLTGVESRSTSVLALRTLRLSRIFKLARSWTSLRMLLRTIKEAVNDVGYFAVLLLLYMLVFSLFGMQLFANRFRFTARTYEPLLPTDVRYFAADVVVPRSNFDTLWNSFMCVFQIITSENWNDILMNASVVAGPAGIIFTVAAQAIGGIVLLSLFLAVVLGAFEGLDDPDSDSLAHAGNPTMPAYWGDASSHRSRSTAASAPMPNDGRLDAKSQKSQLLDASRSYAGGRAHDASRSQPSTVAPSTLDTHRLRSRQARSLARAQKALRKIIAWGRKRVNSVQLILNSLRDAAVMKELLRMRAHIYSVYGGRRRPSLPRVFAAAHPPSAASTTSESKASLPIKPRIVHTQPIKVRQHVLAIPALPRLHSSVMTTLKSPAQIYNSESRETESEASWKDRLSSFGAESFSTHGRGTVASAASTQNVEDEDEERLYTTTTDDDSGNFLHRAQHTHHLSARGVMLFLCSCCSCLWRSYGTRGANDASDAKIISRTLLCFDNRHPLRRLCLTVVLHPAFENLVLLVILLSSITLAIDSPLLDPDGTLAYILAVCDVVWTAFFTAELVVKVIANGLLFTNNAYLRSGWNCLDIGVVAVSIFTLLTDGNVAYRSLRSLRALRALRPLRVISRNPSLKLVVNALFRALQPIFNVMLVCSLMFLIFAIVSTSLFKGATSECTGAIVDLMNDEQFNLIVYPVAFTELSPYQRSWGFACSDGPYAQENFTFFGSDFVDPMSKISCPQGYGYGYTVPDNEVPTSKSVCLWFGGSWDRRMQQSFDNVLSSMGVLLEMSTTENWVAILYTTIDARGVDMQPVREYNLGIGVLWIGFMLFGAYFTVNLFVAAIVDEFERSREQLGESYLLTEAQKEWVRTQEVLLLVRPQRQTRPPADPWKRRVYWMVSAAGFENFVLLLIVINTVTLASPYFGMPQKFVDGLNVASIAFAAAFTCEACLKIYASGWQTYWSSSTWNKFDFIVVIVSDAGILLSQFSTVQVGALGTVARILRIARVVKLAHSLKSLRQMIATLLVTIPSLLNIGALLLLILFIYAVAGVQLFASVQHGNNIDRHANFSNVGYAMLTLWRSLTGESWNSLMYDLVNTPGCNPNPQWDDPFPAGCGNSFAFLYFYSYVIINTFTVVQLLIAVVLEAFSDIADEDAQRLNKDELDKFALLWTQFDPDCTLFMSSSKLRAFLGMLPQPMGFGLAYTATPEEMTAFVASLKLPTYAGNFVHFSDVALACARRVIAAAVADRGENFEDIPNTHGITKRWEKLRGAAVTLQTDWSIQHFVAAEKIFSTFRVFKFRRALAL